MRVQAVTVTLFATRHDLARSVTHEEFITPLALHHGEVENAFVHGEPRRSGEIRIASIRSEGAAVEDVEFDARAAGTFRKAVEFLSRRPVGLLTDMQAEGVHLRAFIEVGVAGASPIIDWPPELCAACRRHGIGLFSVWQYRDPVTH